MFEIKLLKNNRSLHQVNMCGIIAENLGSLLQTIQKTVCSFFAQRTEI